ncbi:hypothetical protein BJ170DRAFT_357366 [Xylariales sp. AK1849]|nr:hypothetical protein BJ170DRAFT_357366 [Xylariales sp. AK1849]
MNNDADPNVSNGTCYYAVNSETKGDFIPCGNAALGHWPCCHAGDICLAFDDSNACWDAGTGNTYLAGCTDIGFNSRTCPWKSPEFIDQEWVAIQQCNEGTGHNDTLWGGCKVSDDSIDLEKLPHASCDSYCSTHIYEGTSAMPAYAILPNSTGSSITWTSDFNPTSQYAVVTTTAEVSGTKTTITSISTHTSATATSSPTSTTAAPSPTADSDGGELSTGAKAGIGVGATIVALLVIAVVLLGLLIRRRKKKARVDQHDVPPEQTQYHTASPHQPSPKPWPDNDVSPGYAGGFKSELPATEQPQRMELPGDASHMRGPMPSPQTSTLSPHSLYATYDSRNSDASTFYSEGITQGGNSRYVSPQSTGDRNQYGPQPARSPGGMGPISELQG